MKNSYTRLSSILIFSIALILSGNVYAADTTPRRVTQPEFDAAIANLQAQIDKLTIPHKKIGDSFGGGIVFYVDATGQHGLIAALSDQTVIDYGIKWSNGLDKVTGATGDGVGAGAKNTTIIVAAQSNDTPGGIFAAKAAADFSVQEDGLTACTGSVDEVCYGDWYLPSKHELNLLYQQKFFDVVSGFSSGANGHYWSSTEVDSSGAWKQHFDNGIADISGKDGQIQVRAIRAF